MNRVLRPPASNGWTFDTDASWIDDALPIPSFSPPSDCQQQQQQVVSSSNALVKQRLQAALSKEQAVQRLNDLLIPVAVLRAAVRRRFSGTTSFTTNAIVSALRRSACCCSHWSLDVLHALLRDARAAHFSKGEVVVHANEPHYACGLVVVMTGEIIESQPNAARKVHKAPCVIGEEAVLCEGVSRSRWSAPLAGRCEVVCIRSSRLWNVALKILTTPGVDPRLWHEFTLTVEPVRREMLVSTFFATPVLLRRSWLFGAWPRESMEELISALEPAVYFPRDAIARQGQVVSCVYFVARGAVSAGLQSFGSSAAAPDISCVSFGELGLFFHDQWQVNIVAASVCDVWQLPASKLNSILEGCSATWRSSLFSRIVGARQRWVGCAANQNISIIIKQLKEVPMLCHCSEEVLIELFRSAQPRSFPQGATLFLHGTRCTALCLILSGVAGPGTPSKSASVAESGSYFGECCLHEHDWEQDWVAQAHVDALVLDSGDAQRVLARARLDTQAVDVCRQGLELKRIHAVSAKAPASAPQPPSEDLLVVSRGRRVATRSHNQVRAPVQAANALWSNWVAQFKDVTPELKRRGSHKKPPATAAVQGTRTAVASLSQTLEEVADTLGMLSYEPFWSDPSISVVGSDKDLCASYTSVLSFPSARHATALRQHACEVSRRRCENRRAGCPPALGPAAAVASALPAEDRRSPEESLITQDSIPSLAQTRELRPMEVLSAAQFGSMRHTASARKVTTGDAKATATISESDVFMQTAPTGSSNGERYRLAPFAPPDRPQTAQAVSPFKRELGLAPPVSTGRPITTGSIASTASPFKEGGDSSMGRSLRPSPPNFGDRQHSEFSDGESHSQSKKRNDPSVKELDAVAVASTMTTTSARPMRPFSAQGRGVPSPLSRIIHVSTDTSFDASSALVDTVVVQDAIWGGTLLESVSPPQALDTLQGSATRQQETAAASLVMPSYMDDIPGEDEPTTRKCHRSNVPAAPPIVLLLHVVGCSNLMGCDSLIEPVVRVVGALSGRTFMTTPVMANMVHPTWSIDKASFISVLLRREDLKISVCDLQDPDGAVLYTATLTTSGLVANSGAGFATIPLVASSTQAAPRGASVSLRLLATSPCKTSSKSSAAADATELRRSADRSSGVSSVVFSVHKCKVVLPPLSPQSNIAKSSSVSIRTSLGDRTVQQLQNHTHARHESQVVEAWWTSAESSCRVESDGGILSFSIAADGLDAGVASVSLDDLAFNGCGVRELTVTSIVGGRPSAATVGLLVLQVHSARVLRDERMSQATSGLYTLLHVESFAASDHMSEQPWLPDPFVTLSIGRHCLLRGPLAFGTLHASWPLSETSLLISCDSDDGDGIRVSICDNSDTSLIGSAVIPQAELNVAARHQEATRIYHLDALGGSVKVRLTPLPVAAVGAFTRHVVRPSACDSSIDSNPILLVIRIASLTSENSSGDATVTLRWAHDTVPILRMVSSHEDRHHIVGIDLSSCGRSSQEEALVFEVWDQASGQDNLASCVGTCKMTLRGLCSSAGQVESLALPVRGAQLTDAERRRSSTQSDDSAETASGGVILVDVFMRRPFRSGAAGVDMLGSSSLLAEALELLDEPETSTPVSETATFLPQGDEPFALSSKTSTSESSMVIRRVLSVHLSVCACHHLPGGASGHPFVVLQSGGAVLCSTPVALSGDMRHPTWAVSPSTAACINLSVVRGRIEEAPPVQLVVMWQNGTCVSEIGRAVVSLHTILNETARHDELIGDQRGRDRAVFGADPTTMCVLRTLQLRGGSISTANMMPEQLDTPSISVCVQRAA